ncbi:hypothetical protein [Pseudorhodoferax sp.]|uniref:hypothetical protein n=1 Tax=Pseudorhodoferax sp. TaxID=1993553 RepID=UPI002DD680E2|nr:hypothetical protein [Pseudorhodoferax sp.]
MTMPAASLRRFIRPAAPGRGADHRAFVVQHLGFAAPELDTLPAVLDEVGRELGVSFTLDSISGDVVLAEQGFVARVAPQVLNAFLDERPLVTVSQAGEAGRRPPGRQLQAELVRKLGELWRPSGSPDAESDPVPAAAAFDPQFDSAHNADQLDEADLDADRAELLNRLRRGMVDPGEPVLLAGYGDRAALAIDFASGVAQVDDRAEQRLRASRDMPLLALGQPPLPDAASREVDLVVWDIALCAGDFRLLNAPANWWHTPLHAARTLSVSRYTRRPHHLDLARALAAGPVAPADLRRQCRVGVTDLRGFLQACLFLGLAYWQRPLPA